MLILRLSSLSGCIALDMERAQNARDDFTRVFVDVVDATLQHGSRAAMMDKRGLRRNLTRAHRTDVVDFGLNSAEWRVGRQHRQYRHRQRCTRQCKNPPAVNDLMAVIEAGI